MVSALGIVVLTGSLAAAQAPAARRPAGGRAPPAPMKNLQVLPKDMPQPQVVAIMRAFNAALGVQCGHCHIWTKPGDPSNDMAADTKTEKTGGARHDADDERDQHEARRQHQEAGRSDCACGMRDLSSRRSDSRHAAASATACRGTGGSAREVNCPVSTRSTEPHGEFLFERQESPCFSAPPCLRVRQRSQPMIATMLNT